MSSETAINFAVSFWSNRYVTQGENIMKRYIRNSIPTLYIVIDLTTSTVNVAASDDFAELKHPSIKRKFRQSNEWLKHVNDLARSIIGSMQGRKFKILKAYPSKKSYTYYIRFQPADKQGDLWDQELQLQIELRDHISDTHTDIGEVTPELFVKTYYLNGKTERDMMSLMRDIFKILDDLENGDFNSFLS